VKKIYLIACSDQKNTKKAIAEDLYVSDLFKKSLQYARSQNPHQIFILSALHHLVPLTKKMAPYNVTLSYVNPKRRNATLKILTPKEKLAWGKKVVQQLSKEANIDKDLFIFLAGQEYIKPLKDNLKNCKDVLKGLRQGERKKFLKDRLL
jgi:hypothetical protein